MTDETKGVTVKTGSGERLHAEGQDVTVTDGHLFVYDGPAGSGGTRIVAAYAPGNWRSVKVAH